MLAGPGTITAIADLTFVISDELGDIRPGPAGMIARDTRHLSCFALSIEGSPLRQLGAALLSPEQAVFHGFVPWGGYPDAPLETVRRRLVTDSGFDEEIGLHWWGPGERTLSLALLMEADFADIFQVRRPGTVPPTNGRIEQRGDVLSLISGDGRRSTEIRLSPAPDTIEGGECRWEATLTRRRPWRLTVTARALPEAETQSVDFAPRAASLDAGVVDSEPPDMARACRLALADLDRLTMTDRADPRRRLLAAGIPWFVALFGRDSLIASYQMRAFAPERLIETLGGLAARQGQVIDPDNDEEPGKILHEVRFTDRPWLGTGTTGGRRPYYGSIDATPLFLIMVGVAFRWGASREALSELIPHVKAALTWMRSHGDMDGDGLLEYRAGGGRSLRNQGWKDSENGVQFADGTIAQGPIALVEVQGYAYRARRELVDVFHWLGHDRLAAELSDEADALRAGIRDRFWVETPGDGPGFFAVALDGEKRPVDSIASNMAHLLWCGVPSNDEAEDVARHLVGDGLASGWGIRTLSREMAGFNPISYHVGSVWPHDTAIACEGLRKYALDGDALAIAGSLLDALNAFGGRLPELFGGHPRKDHPLPVPYPSACRPQAWAAGVPLSFVPLLLGLEPDLHQGVLSLSPMLPDSVTRLTVHNLPLPTGRLSVEVGPDGTRLIEIPPNLSVELRAPAAG